jgi:hypothetical protein
MFFFKRWVFKRLPLYKGTVRLRDVYGLRTKPVKLRHELEKAVFGKHGV